MRRKRHNDDALIQLGRRVNIGVTKPGKEVSASETVTSSIDKPAPYIRVDPQYSFSDMVLASNTYDAIQDTLALYDNRELIFETWGLGTTHKQQQKAGINLYGPSGTGKSMAAHAIAHQLGKQILIVDYAQIESKYVGETSKNLTEMFTLAKQTESVLFFDEADALLSKRVTNMTQATDVSVNQTRSVLLTLINNYTGLLLFATNFISNYDPAFMRRILAHIRFDLPDENGRNKLWRHYIPKQMPTNVDIQKLAKNYSGISGSDIANAVLKAALKAARRGDSIVEHEYFSEAIHQAIAAKQESEDLGTLRVRRGLTKEQVEAELREGKNDSI